MRRRWDKKASSSPTSAIIALIVVVVVVALALITFMGMTVSEDIVVEITPTLYSPENNIGVLNENGAFNIQVRNNRNYSVELIIAVDNDNGRLSSTHLVVDAKSDNGTTVHQKLIYVGTWVVSVMTEDQKPINSYSFVTVTNSIDAEIQITALNDIQQTKNSASISNIIAILSLAVSIVALFFSTRKSGKE